jgi:hypothetical protein
VVRIKTINAEHAEHAETLDAAPQSGGAGLPIADERRLRLVGVRPRWRAERSACLGQAARVERIAERSRSIVSADSARSAFYVVVAVIGTGSGQGTEWSRRS